MNTRLWLHHAPLGSKDMGVSLPHRYADASGTRVASLDTDPIMSWVYPPGTLWVWDSGPYPNYPQTFLLLASLSKRTIGLELFPSALQALRAARPLFQDIGHLIYPPRLLFADGLSVDLWPFLHPLQDTRPASPN